jgi:DNA-binding Lrp family transcriptional regulator
VKLLRTETVRILDQYSGIKEISKQLAPTNIAIFTAMAKVGPRNLPEVSRLTGIPYTTVNHRISQIEANSREISILVPKVTKLGMIRLVVLVAAKPGLENAVSQALKIPNYWRVVERCEGAFTHHSIQTVPVKFLKIFREYISTMRAMNLIKSYRIIETSDSTSIFPAFSNYDSCFGNWTFHWDEWLSELQTRTPEKTIEDPKIDEITMDKTDLKIIAYLQLNGRLTFTEIAKKIGVSPQTVKYHYDKKLVPSGIVDEFDLDVDPYPVDISTYHEFMLEFTDNVAMNQFFSLADKLFFVDHLSKAARKNTLLVRTRVIQSQVSNLFTFFSEMTNLGLLNAYSAVRLDMYSREMDTITFDLFDEVEGWQWDVYKNLLELNKL